LPVKAIQHCQAKNMMEIIENCMMKGPDRGADSCGLHALHSMWDNSDSYNFSPIAILKSNKTLLMTAAKMGHLECSKFLLSLHSNGINTTNNDGFTALHYAAYHGHEDIAFLLLDMGADPKLRNNFKEDALDSAVTKNHTKLVERLRKSRYYSPPKPAIDLFDFSGDFLNDMNKRLDSLNSASVNDNSSNTADATDDSSKKIDSSNYYLSDGEIIEEADNRTKVVVNPQKVEQKKVQQDKSKSLTTSLDHKMLPGLSRQEASKYFLEIISVTDYGEMSLIGKTCECLSSDTNETSVKVKGTLSNTKTESVAIPGKIKDDLTIGRSRLNDLALDDLSVSKQHAVISYFNNVGFILRDLGSKHGTFVNDRRLGVTNSSLTLDTAKSNKSIEKDTKPKDEGSSGNNKVYKNNNGLLLTEGMEIKFGRILCKMRRKRQAAVITSG
jgi:hypothetical protein